MAVRSYTPGKVRACPLKESPAEDRATQGWKLSMGFEPDDRLPEPE